VLFLAALLGGNRARDVRVELSERLGTMEHLGGSSCREREKAARIGRIEVIKARNCSATVNDPSLEGPSSARRISFNQRELRFERCVYRAFWLAWPTFPHPDPDPAMAQYVFTMKGVTKVVPGNRKILENIWLSFFPGAKIGVLGLNGAGKSTLLRIMAGVDKEFDGEATPQPNIKIGFLPQEPALDPSQDVRGNVEEAVAHVKALLTEFDEISAKFAEPMDDDAMNALLERQGDLQTQIEAIGGWELDRTLDIAADALRLPPWDAEVTKLSGGEKRRVALCKLLLSRPDMLLLDEPTNHLDAESVAWLERFLAEYPGTVVAVTHDRYFLDNVAGWILELDRGKGIPFEGNYSAWLDAKDKRLDVEASQEKARQRAIKAELEWVRANPKGRQAKSKARLARFEELTSKEVQARNETAELYIPAATRLGERVIELEKVAKGYDDRLLIDELTVSIPRGAIVGIIGGNGAGKTTLFRMITGAEKPDSGTIDVGNTAQIAYVDQSRDELDGNKTVWEQVSDGLDVIRIGTYEIPSRAYVGRFNFRGPDQQKRVGDLSGGERNRLHLAKLLRRGANVLLLDEPTNDLDVETLRALEEALLSFAGTALIVSHDRWFLDRIATHVLAFEGDSHVEWFAGNFSEYEKDRKRRVGEEDHPTRLRYKKLTH
jgi:ATP-binding cassette ChvD family protein